jgi:uncharacterized membrane protein YkoI
MRSTWKKAGVVAGAVTAVALTGAGAAIATGDDDATGRSISGDALERAEEAALTATGGGTVTDTEVDDEESYYEVEVTLEDGSQVDVQLDRDFRVVGTGSDGERRA